MKGNKGLSAWNLTMMALGVVVGGSFFLGSSVAIRSAGPGVIISYILGGFLVYLILLALSEMTVNDPQPGSFRIYAQRAYGQGLGFVVGWIYWTGIVLAMSSEAIAVSVFLRRWFPNISLIIIGSVIIIIITLLNLLGADKISKIESGLASLKLISIIGFIIIAIVLIFGFLPNLPRVGNNIINNEPLFPNGIGGIAGSMLIVMFTYAGFEMIGLAASETSNPHEVVPKAIKYTVLGLVGLYVVSIAVLLPLISTQSVNPERSPMVLALTNWKLSWAGSVMNIVLIIAIISTMLAAMFGLGRMIRSLADEGHAPLWLKDTANIPYKGISFSGAAMLLGLYFGFILPQQIYMFLVSSGGFALIFTYLIILVSHYEFRKQKGCPNGKCQLPGYPYTSWFGIISIFGIIISMPLVPGQGHGLVAGIILLALYSIIYLIVKNYKNKIVGKKHIFKDIKNMNMDVSMEISKEKNPVDTKKKRRRE